MSKENVPKTTTMTNKKIDETPNYELEDFIIKKQQDRSFSFVTKRPIRISNASTLILDSPMNSDVQTSMSSTASSLSTPEQQQSLRKGSEFWSSPERFDDDLGYQPLKGMLSTLLLSSSKSKTRSRSIPQQQQQQQQKSQQPLSPTIMHQDDNQSRLPTHRMRISEAPTLILSDFSNSDSSDSSPSLSPPSQSQSKQQPSPSNSEPLLTIKYQRKIWHPSMEFESTSVSSLPLGDDEKINGKIPQPSKQDDNLRKSSPSTSKQQQQQLDDINSKKTEKISIKIHIYEHDRLLREKMLKNDAEFDSTRQREEDEMMKLQQKSSTSSTSSSSESEFLGKSSNPITSVDGSLRHKSFAPNRRVKSNDELKTITTAISTETLKSKNRKKSKKRTNQPKRSLIFKSLQDIDQLDDDYDPEHGLRQLASFETDSETAERKNELLKHLASYEQQHSFTGGGRRRRIDRISSSEEYENEMRANLLPTIRPTTTKTPPLPSPTITDMEKLEKIINEFNLQFKLSKVRNLSSVKNEPKMIQVEKHDKNWFRKQQMDDFKKSCSSGSGILRSDSGSGIRRSDSSSGSSRKRLSVPKIRSPTDRRHKSIGKSVDQQQQQQRRRRSPPISLPPPMSPSSASTSESSASTSASSASTSLPPRPSSSKSKSKSKLPQPKQVPSSSESESESDSSSSSSISITPRTSESESASISTSSLSSGSSSAAGSPLPPLKAPSASSLDRQKSTGKIPKQISKQQQQTKRKRRKKYHGPLMRRLSIPNRQLRRFIHKMFHTIINHNENNNIIINQPKMMITRDAIEILNSMAKELIRKYAEYADQLILYSGRRKMDRWVSFSTIKMFLSPTLNHTTKESIIQIINDYGYYQDLNDRSEIKHKSQITEQQSQSQSQSQQPGPSTSSLASSSTSKSNIPSSKQQP